MKKNPVAHVEGFEELNKALRDVGNRAGGLVLEKAAEAGAKIIADEAKRLAPRKTGALAEGITIEPARIQNGRAQINIGFSKKTWYGRLVELGHHVRRAKKGQKNTSKFVPPHPFLRPAFDAKAAEAVDAVENSLRDQLRDVLS